MLARILSVLFIWCTGTAHMSTALSLGGKKAIIFDIDGTLCDSSLLCYQSTNAVLSSNNYPIISLDEYKDGSKYTTPRRFAWHVSKNPNDAIGNTLGAQFDDMYVSMVTSQSVPLFPKIESMIYSLKKKDASIVLGALTNACSPYAKAIQKSNAAFTDHFHICYGVDDVPSAKPSGDGLLMMCAKIGVDPSDAVYVGDAPTDGQAAAAAGLRSVGVTWGSYATALMLPHFDQMVDTVDDLEILLQKFLGV